MKADRKPAKEAAVDRGEAIALIEPLVISQGSRHRTRLTDLALELGQRAAGFRKSLPGGVMAALADLVRAMNCYYGNLIEGHTTHPVDIERAMRNDYSTDPAKRNLQLEAKAHVTVQKWIDERGLDGRAFTAAGICDVHKRFCDLVPEELLWAEHPDTGDTCQILAIPAPLVILGPSPRMTRGAGIAEASFARHVAPSVSLRAGRQGS